MKTGLIHRPAPAAVPLLADRANLAAHAVPPERNWQRDVDVTDPLRNLDLGDCVPVAALRSIEVRLTTAGRSSWMPTGTDAVRLYGAWASYDPANPATDHGTDVVKAMTTWCTAGVLVVPGLLDIPQWTKLDPQNIDHIKLAIELTGGVLFSFALPLAVQYAPAWNVVPDGSVGAVKGGWADHRVFCGRYDADGVWGITWGQEIPISWAFVSAYAIAADAVLSWDWFEVTGVTPAGLMREALAADMRGLARGGRGPAPCPP
jgi:hypothetical protein